MVDNRISAEFSTQEQHTVMEAIATIRESLPFLIDVSPDERKSMLKLGDRNRAFTRKALEIATQTPDFLPRSFDIDEMRRDLELFESLQPMLLALMKLQELIEDTAVAAGSEAYVAALEVYRYAKANGSVGGLDSLIDEMGRRFAQNGNRGRSTAQVPSGS